MEEAGSHRAGVLSTQDVRDHRNCQRESLGTQRGTQQEKGTARPTGFTREGTDAASQEREQKSRQHEMGSPPYELHAAVVISLY